MKVKPEEMAEDAEELEAEVDDADECDPENDTVNKTTNINLPIASSINISANPSTGVTFQCVISHAKDPEWEKKYRLMSNIALAVIQAHQGTRNMLIKEHEESGKNDNAVR
jgi:hypothetical protein